MRASQGSAPAADEPEAAAPVPGWDAAYDWQGTVDKRENPVVVNPLRGAVATANSNWLPEGYPEGYPHHITYDWAEPQRQARVEQLFVDSSQMQSVQTMLDGQADRYSGGMVALRDTILRLLPQGVRIDEELIRGLAGWDGRMTADSPFPLIITAWHRHLGETVLRDDLGEDYGSIPPANLDRLMEILRDAGARNWCDNIATSEAEDCGDAIFAAGQAMLAELKADYGDDWHRWRWGTAHETVHEHRPFSRVGALSGFFTIRAEMDGGRYTLLRNSTDFAGKMPYAGVHGSALRTVYDFADLEKSLYMISTGQSGNVFSPHYRDLNALWARLDYVTIPTEPAAYRAAAAGTFTLTPGTAQ